MADSKKPISPKTSSLQVGRMSRSLDRRIHRRGFLSRVAKLGAVVALAPVAGVLRPLPAWAGSPSDCINGTCNSGSTCCSQGTSVFCCQLSGGNNNCPSGTSRSGYWRCSASSGTCYGGASNARFYIDCNVSSGSNCSCKCGGNDCSKRRTCCNSREWHNCNHDQIFGSIKCRIVRCSNPSGLFNDCHHKNTREPSCSGDAACL